MADKKDIEIIKTVASDFFSSMTFPVLDITVNPIIQANTVENQLEALEVAISLEDPKIMIGQAGQTLFDIQRLLKVMVNKKVAKPYYISVDINHYKEKKSEYLAQLATELADQVVLTRTEKTLAPMPSYERRMLHQELSRRQDVVSESQGEGPSRHIVIKYKA